MWRRSSSSSFEVRNDSGGGRVAVMRTFALKDSLGVVGGAGGGVASLDSCRVLSFSFRNRANTFNERVAWVVTGEGGPADQVCQCHGFHGLNNQIIEKTRDVTPVTD